MLSLPLACRRSLADIVTFGTWNSRSWPALSRGSGAAVSKQSSPAATVLSATRASRSSGRPPRSVIIISIILIIIIEERNKGESKATNDITFENTPLSVYISPWSSSSSPAPCSLSASGSCYSSPPESRTPGTGSRSGAGVNILKYFAIFCIKLQ